MKKENENGTIRRGIYAPKALTQKSSHTFKALPGSKHLAACSLRAILRTMLGHSPLMGVGDSLLLLDPKGKRGVTILMGVLLLSGLHRTSLPGT